MDPIVHPHAVGTALGADHVDRLADAGKAADQRGAAEVHRRRSNGGAVVGNGDGRGQRQGRGAAVLRTEQAQATNAYAGADVVHHLHVERHGVGSGRHHGAGHGAQEERQAEHHLVAGADTQPQQLAAAVGNDGATNAQFRGAGGVGTQLHRDGIAQAQRAPIASGAGGAD